MMKRRWLDGLLLLVIIIGGVLAWKSGRERSRLANTYQRLARKTGDLTIGDPTKVHVLALDTREPLHFAWRVYLPPNYNVILRTNTQGESRSWRKDATEFIARVRIREDDEGNLLVYTAYSGGSGVGAVGEEELAKLLRNRLDRIVVEQLGRNGVTPIEPDRATTLLRLTLPDDLKNEAQNALPAWTLKAFVPVLFEWKLGKDPTSP